MKTVAREGMIGITCYAAKRRQAVGESIGDVVAALRQRDFGAVVRGNADEREARGEDDQLVGAGGGGKHHGRIAGVNGGGEIWALQELPRNAKAKSGKLQKVSPQPCYPMAFRLKCLEPVELEYPRLVEPVLPVELTLQEKGLHWENETGRRLRALELEPEHLQLQRARGREMARVRLRGTLKGTLPVTIRQRQSLPLLMRDLSELQHSEGGLLPLRLLLVTKFMHGVNVVIMEGVHGVEIWAEAGERRSVVAMSARAEIEIREAMLLLLLMLMMMCGKW
ncbi:hypothetical protein SASPL_100444 [Salvia splendens]|uniref:Uncharacterized protein n=1 Tax=Salvia splendens TaxID=180675 RepID=A0A8X8YME1_SALSN|nr:hypothetical protein SASPL_100444 [Salvia splendens]